MKKSIDRIRGITVVLLACVAVLGCQPTTTGTDPERIPDDPVAAEGSADEQTLTGHDDPIVIDNAPVRIALGDMSTSNNDEQWSRPLHRLDYMAILRRDPNGNIVFKEHVPLCRNNCTITLGLVRGNSNHVTTHLIFEATPGAAGQLVMKDENSRKFKKSARWLDPLEPGNSSQKDNLWIRTVLVEESGVTNPLFSRDFGRGGANYQVDIVILTSESMNVESIQK